MFRHSMSSGANICRASSGRATSRHSSKVRTQHEYIIRTTIAAAPACVSSTRSRSLSPAASCNGPVIGGDNEMARASKARTHRFQILIAQTTMPAGSRMRSTTRTPRPGTRSSGAAPRYSHPPESARDSRAPSWSSDPRARSSCRPASAGTSSCSENRSAAAASPPDTADARASAAARDSAARRRMRNRAERRVVNAPQPIRAIQRVGRVQDRCVGARIRADDDLRALPCG